MSGVFVHLIPNISQVMFYLCINNEQAFRALYFLLVHRLIMDISVTGKQLVHVIRYFVKRLKILVIL